MTREEIGRIIRESRLAAGLTQLQVAETLGRPQQTIAAWEAGRSQPDANTLFDLFQVLGRSVDEAFGFQKNTPPLSGRAVKLAQAFDELDEPGKAFLEDSIGREEKRMETEAKLQTFTNVFATLWIYKVPITDTIGIDLKEEPEIKTVSTSAKTPEDQRNAVKQVMLVKNAFGVRFRFDDGKEIIFAIDSDNVTKPGQIGMFIIDGKAFLKRLENDGLYPIQSDSDSIPVPDALNHAGRVISWFGANLVSDGPNFILRF